MDSEKYQLGMYKILTGTLIYKDNKWTIKPDSLGENVVVDALTRRGVVEEDPNGHGDLFITKTYGVNLGAPPNDFFMQGGLKVAYTPVTLDKNIFRAVAIAEIESYEKAKAVIDKRPDRRRPEIRIGYEDYTDYETLWTTLWSGYDYYEQLNSGTMPFSIIDAGSIVELILGHENIRLPYPTTFHPLYKK